MSYHLVVCLNPTLQRTLSFSTITMGQVNRTVENREDASGKGVNVSRILTELGEDALHLTQSGGESGRRFLEFCAADNVLVKPVESSAGIRTCYTLVDREHSQTTELVEPGLPVDSATEVRVRDAYDASLADAHTVIISGSKAPGFSDELYPDLVAKARSAGLRVILDIRGGELIKAMEHQPSLIKINVSEFAATFTSTALSEGLEIPLTVRDAVRRLAEQGTDVVLTNGDRPALLADAGVVREVAVKPVTPVNTIGCGDAVTAGIAAALHRGSSLAEALALGLGCAAQNAVQIKPGTIRHSQ